MNPNASEGGRRRFRATNLVVIIVLSIAAVGLALLAGRIVQTVLAPEPAREALRDAGSEPGLTGQAAVADHDRRLRQGQGANQEAYSVQNKVYEGREQLKREQEAGTAPRAPRPAPAPASDQGPTTP